MKILEAREARMNHGRIYRVVRGMVISLPVFLFLCPLLLFVLPGATGMFSDSAGPWYEPVTSKLFLAGLVYAYPITFLCTRLISDDMFFSPGYLVVLAVYTTGWVILLRAAFRFFEARRRPVE